MAKMLDSCLVRQCAPTLAGVKVGSLFCLEIADGVLLCNILARWNKALNVKGVFARVLAEKNGRYYIYVYRDCELERLSKIGEVQSFLKDFGYAEFDVESLLKFFKVRMAKSACFPHEVGVFLGYPLDDVPNSMHVFEVYKKCQKIMADMFERGVSLERLTVAS